MRFRLLTLLISSAVLLGGCAIPGSECSWTQTMNFASQSSVEWLAKNDPMLLRLVVEHNEKRQEFCH